MDKTKFKEGFQKYTMIIVLVLVTIFFAWGTQGKILLPQNINNLISQNAYVFVLATGMLLCILTGGNIDLSVDDNGTIPADQQPVIEYIKVLD